MSSVSLRAPASGSLVLIASFLAFTLSAVGAFAQAEPQPSPAPEATSGHQAAGHEMSGMDMQGMSMPGMDMNDPGAEVLMQHASGTSLNPASAPMEMISLTRGDWTVMGHLSGFLNYTDQSGLRGDEKFFSTNWAMGMAQRKLGTGTLMLRTMLSLEPATISDRKYPLLFQTGETAFGRPIIDGQHPHDFFMELAAEYAHPLGRDAWVTLYVAPVGDPALGPVAFPHRTSAAEIPQATIGHHFQDSTHIAYDVITGGINYGKFRLEASTFHGAEPDEKRWDIESGSLDSWAVRFSWLPTPNLVAQLSSGFLKKPEALEPGDAKRVTSSIAYNLPLPSGAWSSSLIWGQIYKQSHDQTLNSWLAESSFNFFRRHYIASRIEFVDKDELFPHLHPPGTPFGQPVPTFKVKAYTLGYTFDVLQTDKLRTGVGVNYTHFDFPSVLKFFYGDNPHGIFAFIRLRTAAGSSQHHSM